MMHYMNEYVEARALAVRAHMEIAEGRFEKGGDIYYEALELLLAAIGK